jgi:transcriptional regulator with XRE-family HTH domain
MERTERFDQLMLDFGRAVRELRRARGWSAERLALRSPVTFSTVLDIERGNRDPRASTVLGLMDTLEASPEAMLLAVREARESDAGVEKLAAHDVTKEVA